MLIHKSTITNPSAPLFVFVHGRGGNVDVMKLFERVIPPGCNTVFVQAPEKELDEQVGGYSWWQVGKKENAAGRASELLGFLDNFIKQNSLMPECINALGFSQGGALLSVCLQHEPAFFSKVVLLASFVIKENIKANAAKKTRVLMIHGSNDQIVEVSRALGSLEHLRGGGFETADFIEEGVGHKIGIQGFRKLRDWLADH